MWRRLAIVRRSRLSIISGSCSAQLSWSDRRRLARWTRCDVTPYDVTGIPGVTSHTVRAVYTQILNISIFNSRPPLQRFESPPTFVVCLSLFPKADEKIRKSEPTNWLVASNDSKNVFCLLPKIGKHGTIRIEFQPYRTDNFLHVTQWRWPIATVNWLYRAKDAVSAAHPATPSSQVRHDVTLSRRDAT